MKKASVIIFFSLFCLNTVSLAATISTTFNVTATIQSTCSTVTASNLVFGNYDPFAASATDQTNVVQVTCTNGTPYTIALNSGSTSGATIANRLMANGPNTLNYNIYTTNARTTIWGDGTSSSVTQAGTGNGTAQSYTAYGRIPAGQTAKPTGNYSDTVHVTVTF
jgi:spore coat protein U-like protein